MVADIGLHKLIDTRKYQLLIVCYSKFFETENEVYCLGELNLVTYDCSVNSYHGMMIHQQLLPILQVL